MILGFRPVWWGHVEEDFWGVMIDDVGINSVVVLVGGIDRAKFGF